MDDCANAQYPPITAAIRSRVESGWDPWPEAREWLLGKCDTIDAIHARLEAAYDRLRAEGEHDFAPESHYVMLPKDADGEPVHIGDVMEWPDGETFEVVGIGGNTLFYIKDGLAEWVDARNKRHHIPDTWERIIEDAINASESAELGDGTYEQAVTALVARCKALAGDAE